MGLSTIKPARSYHFINGIKATDVAAKKATFFKSNEELLDFFTALRGNERFTIEDGDLKKN